MFDSESLSALVLGIVEGFTEYLPISSTGHMILAGKLLGYEGDKASAFEIFIQLGAILAVVVLYWRRFVSLFDRKAARGLRGINGLIKLAVCCFPAAFLGLLVRKQIKLYLFEPLPVAIALIAGGIVMLLVREPDERISSVDDLTLRDALIIGLFQCFALWPGVSRSGSMIIGGMLIGVTRITAAEFSFLVAVPMMTMAAGYELLKSKDLLTSADIMNFGIGFVTAFIFAMLAIKFFLNLLARYSLRPFGVYRIALGAVALIMIFISH